MARSIFQPLMELNLSDVDEVLLAPAQLSRAEQMCVEESRNKVTILVLGAGNLKRFERNTARYVKLSDPLQLSIICIRFSVCDGTTEHGIVAAQQTALSDTSLAVEIQKRFTMFH